MFTCDIDVNSGKGCQWDSSNILGSDPQHKVPGGLIVQGLRYQDGGRAVLSIWGQVEANWHVGLWDHAVLQIVRYPGIPQRGGGFDGLFGTEKERG